MQELSVHITDTSMEEIDAIANKATSAFAIYRKLPSATRVEFLDNIASLIETNTSSLAALASSETNLPIPRLSNEINRTIGQCRVFARLIREGSWVRAIIDHADPDRQPLPRPDIRNMQQPLGPVAVFGASNFPFAYSVAGGDTAAALAAGCTVIYKANPGHPRTSLAVTKLIKEAASLQGLPDGVFEMITGSGKETGQRLVTNVNIKAVGFTGSLQGGRALFDAAAKRAEPIPVYAEMGSTNPVFILEGILKKNAAAIARELAASNTASVGQFCTNPGIMVMQASDQQKHFHDELASWITKTPAAPMLTPAIRDNFEKSMKALSANKNVALLSSADSQNEFEVAAYAFHTSAAHFLRDPALHEEMFGPGSIQVTATDNRELLAVAKALPGQITASVWGTDEDLLQNSELLSVLEEKTGRVIINGVPTGVEVVHAMNHGGPYPATTDSKFTSVGSQSIYRFTRPVCYQNYPDAFLPDELKANNPLNIMRMEDGKMKGG